MTSDRLKTSIEAAAKRLRLGVEGPACADELEAAFAAEQAECICRGNWRTIVKEAEPLLGKQFTDRNGDRWFLYGIVHADDDYYYGMCGESGSGQKRSVLLSCVGSLETHGYKLKVHVPEHAERGWQPK